MSWREKKRLYNISLLLIYHAAQSIMGRIDSLLLYSDSSTQFHWRSRPNIRPRIERAEWMWSGLCGWGSLCQRRCRRTEFLHCDPQTLLFYCWWTLQRDQSLSYCVWMSIWKEAAQTPRTDHYIQTRTQHLIPSCWCSYMTLIYTHKPDSPATPIQLPVTASTHTLSTQHLSITNWNLSGWSGYDWTVSVLVITLLFSDRRRGYYSLCSDPEWADGIWWDKTHQNQELWICFECFHVAELFMVQCSSVFQSGLENEKK